MGFLFFPKSSQGYLLQPMLSGGIEFVVGVKVDATMGPAVLLGLGGVFIDAYGKPVIEMAPISRTVASSMIAALDLNPVIVTTRGAFAVDALVSLRATQNVNSSAVLQ